MKSKTVDQKNHILSLFAKYASLNVLGMLGLSCYIMADTFFIAQGMGVNGLTALNLAIPVYSLIHGTGLMLGMGGATRYSILKGKGTSKSTDDIFTQSIIYAILISSIFFAAGIFLANPLSRLLGADNSVIELTSTYLRVILLFTPMFMLNNVLNCFIRNDGNPKLSMIAMITGSLSNVILDYIFIFPMKMGMFGAAFATGLAPIISIIILSFHFIHKKNNMKLTRVKISFNSLKDIGGLGSSSLVMELSSGIVMLVFNTIILKLQGNIGVAAYGVIANISLVILGIFTGIAQGIQPIISRYYGGGNEKSIQKTYRYAIITAISFALAIYAIILMYTEEIISIFNKEQNAILTEIAGNGLRIYFVALVCVGFNMVTSVFFSSIDRPIQSFLISILRGFIIIIPMAFLLSAIFGMNGVWFAFPITEALTLICTIVLFIKSKKNRN